MDGLTIWHYLPQLVLILIIGLMIYFARKTTKANNGIPKGIYGWLLFFVLTLIFAGFNAVLSAYREFANLMSIYPDIKYHKEFQLLYKMPLFTAWVQAGICLYLVYILKTKKAEGTIKKVICGIWAVGLGVNTMMYIILLIALPDFVSLDAQVMKDAFIQPFIYALFWTFYLKKSKRVKNTYPSLIINTIDADKVDNKQQKIDSEPKIDTLVSTKTRTSKIVIDHDKDMTVKDRLAIVIWWIGAGSAILSILAALFVREWFFILFGFAAWLVSATLCYIISGYFKLPPNIKRTNQR